MRVNRCLRRCPEAQPSRTTACRRRLPAVPGTRCCMVQDRRFEGMAQAVRAVYEQGWLRLLDPVNLIEGQEVHVMLVSERERARDVLDEILVQYEPEPVEEIDEIKLLAEIDAAMQGKPPIS